MIVGCHSRNTFNKYYYKSQINQYKNVKITIKNGLYHMQKKKVVIIGALGIDFKKREIYRENDFSIGDPTEKFIVIN